MADTGTTLARRLALTLALVAGVSAAIATLTAMLLADALIVARAERSVAAATRVMKVEVDEAPAVAGHVEQEARTLGIDGRVAILRDGAVIQGDAGLAGSHLDGCEITDLGAARALVCSEFLASSPGDRIVVAVPEDRAHGHRFALLLAAVAVLVGVSVSAGVIGARLSTRFLAPLDRLRRAVVGIDAAAPTSVALPRPTGVEEIDALRHAVENLLQRLGGELGRARHFAASASHELRTPLARMRAELELASEETDVPAAQAAVFMRLTATVGRLEILIERLLLLATPQEILATNHATSMAHVVEDLVRRRTPAQTNRLVVYVCDADALVRGDEHLLAAMLDNLVDNALEFSEGDVRVTVIELENDVVVDVADDGPGIPAHVEREVFEPFYRAARGKGRPGHGLGLPLAVHIARAHGGDVTSLRDRAGRGATLRVRIPLHRGRGSNGVPLADAVVA